MEMEEKTGPTPEFTVQFPVKHEKKHRDARFLINKYTQYSVKTNGAVKYTLTQGEDAENSAFFPRITPTNTTLEITWECAVVFSGAHRLQIRAMMLPGKDRGLVDRFIPNHHIYRVIAKDTKFF